MLLDELTLPLEQEIELTSESAERYRQLYCYLNQCIKKDRCRPLLAVIALALPDIAKDANRSIYQVLSELNYLVVTNHKRKHGQSA